MNRTCYLKLLPLSIILITFLLIQYIKSAAEENGVIKKEISDDFEYTDIAKNWLQGEYNPTGTWTIEKGVLKVSVDPTPTAIYIYTKELYELNRLNMAVDVAFTDDDTVRAGPLLSVTDHSDFILGFLWHKDGSIFFQYGRAVDNPEKQKIYCCKVPETGKFYRFGIQFNKGRVAVLVDDKKLFETTIRHQVIPPSHLVVFAQNYDSVWRHFEFDNFTAEIEAVIPKGGSDVIKSEAKKGTGKDTEKQRREAQAWIVRALRVSPLNFILLWWGIFTAGLFATTISMRLRNYKGHEILLLIGSVFFLIFMIELLFQISFPGGYAARAYTKYAFGQDSDIFLGRSIEETPAPDGRPLWYYTDIKDRVWQAGKQPVVIITGDSITFGIGVKKEEQTYAMVAQKVLKEKGNDWRILNLSSPGYSTRDERYMLEMFCEGLNIKAVVVGHVYDDV
ncbi:MAG: hypothetical protein AB1546_01845, partial [bacterium]